MDKVTDPSKANPGRNDTASSAPSTPPDSDVSPETSAPTPQQQRIEAQRAQLLQAHGVLKDFCTFCRMTAAHADEPAYDWRTGRKTEQ